MLGIFIFTLVAYVIPLSFSGYLFTSDVKQSIHTHVAKEQINFIADRIFTYVEYKSTVHNFIGFRFTYIMCLWVSGILVSLAQEIYAESTRKSSLAKGKKHKH